MALCPNCGADVEGNYCARCGTAVPAAATAGPGSGQYAAQATAAGMSDNLAGALSYALGLITGVLFLALAPYNKNRFVRFHAFQSIFFHVAFVGIWIIETVVLAFLPWSLAAVLSLLGMLIALGGLAVWLLLLFKAYQGERFKLPVIGDLADKQA